MALPDNILDRVITIYPNVNTTDKPSFITLKTELNRIKTGGKGIDHIMAIRRETDNNRRNSLKERLPSVVFTGHFINRKDKGLKQYSRIVTIDFDHVGISFKDEIIKDPYVLAAWISPSGDGVKVLYHVSTDNHVGHYRAILQKFPQADTKNKNISRVCYESYDPDIYINTEALVWDSIIEEPTYEAKTITYKDIEQDSEIIYKHLKTYSEKRGAFIEGNRNNFLMYLLASCNRYGISKHDAGYLVSTDYVSGSTDFRGEEFERIINGVYKRYSFEHGTKAFEKHETKDKNIQSLVNADLDTFIIPDDLKDFIFANDVKPEMLAAFNEGRRTGETTYFREIDPHYKWAKGEVTVLHGIGNYGKTSFMMQLMLCKSIMEGTKWIIFSPEQYPPDTFFDDLVQSYIGKTTLFGAYDKMTESEFRKGIEFVNEHFTYVYPKEASHNVDYILEQFGKGIIKHRADGVMIDPFNMLDRDWGKYARDDQYVGDCLTKFKRFALLNSVYFIVVAHPKGMGMSKMKDGNYSCPDMFDLAGGAIWGAKSDNIIAYHRPTFHTDKTSTDFQFISQKIKKQKLNGIPGEIQGTYSRGSGRYFINGYNPIDDLKARKRGEKLIEIPIESNFEYQKDDDEPF